MEKTLYENECQKIVRYKEPTGSSDKYGMYYFGDFSDFFSGETITDVVESFRKRKREING